MTAKKTPKTEKPTEDAQVRLGELTADLQRTRADFENYRKRTEQEKISARQAGKMQAIMELLPVIDNIERALGYVPDELADNTWAQSVAGLVKNLDKSLEKLALKRIVATPGTAFDPELHQAIAIDEADGDHEVIAEELQGGYILGDSVLRPSMVKVTRR